MRTQVSLGREIQYVPETGVVRETLPWGSVHEIYVREAINQKDGVVLTAMVSELRAKGYKVIPPSTVAALYDVLTDAAEYEEPERYPSRMSRLYELAELDDGRGME